SFLARPAQPAQGTDQAGPGPPAIRHSHPALLPAHGSGGELARSCTRRGEVGGAGPAHRLAVSRRRSAVRGLSCHWGRSAVPDDGYAGWDGRRDRTVPSIQGPRGGQRVVSAVRGGRVIWFVAGCCFVVSACGG